MKKIILLFLISGFISVNAQLPGYVPTNGLVGFWPFTGNANDASGNGHNGTVSGASLVSDRFSTLNCAYSFNGTSDRIMVPNSPALSAFTDMSISAWINISSMPSGAQGIVTKWFQASCITPGVNSDTYEAALSANTIQFATNNNNLTGFTSPPLFSPANLNTWVHLVFIAQASGNMSIYVNGVFAASHSAVGTICNSSNPVYFGTDLNGSLSSFHRFFNGLIDDIGIWNRALTACEIQALFTSSPMAPLVVTATHTSICSNGSATLTANSGGNTISWLNPGLSGTMVVVSPTATTVYTAQATATVGAITCTTQQTFTLVVDPIPNLGVINGPNPVCIGASATITAMGASNFTWTGIGTGSAIIVSPVVNTTYTVFGSNSVSGSCSGSLSVTQSVVPSTTISILASDTIICAGDQIVLSALGIMANYTWQPGNTTGGSVTVTPLATTIYTVTGSNVAGCIPSATLAIIVTSPFTINATANPSVLCPGDPCTLTATGATSYTWLPGNLSGSLVVVNPTGATVYTVIGENGGCRNSDSVNVKTGRDLFISTSGNLCNNNSINLFVTPTTSLDLITWAGPGIVGPSTTSLITINAGGTYSVAVNNTLTGCSGTTSILVTNSVNPISLNVIPSSTVTCFPGPAVNMLVSAPVYLSWLPSSEVTPNNGPLVSVNPSVTTTYTVIGVLGSCTGSAAVTISVNVTPTVVNISADPTVCAGVQATLTATGAPDYIWMPGNLSGSTVTVTPLTSTTYILIGYVGSCTSTVSVPVNVLPAPSLTANALPPTICIGHSSTLTVAGGSVMAWIIGDPPPVSHTAAVTPSASMIYTAVGSNSLGCSSTVTITLNVINSPAISAIASSTSVCIGDSVTFTALGASTYTWFPGNLNGQVITVTPTASINYTVISGNAFCSYATVPVIVNNCVNVSFGLTNAAGSPQQSGSEHYRITFTVTANNASNSDLVDVVLNDDLAATFLSPITFTVLNAPTITSGNSALAINPFFNGNSDLSLTSSSNSTLMANKRDTIVFSVLMDPNGFAGTLKNFLIGFARAANNIIASDSSNNGFEWDPDNNGDPTDNNTPTPIEIELIELFIPEGFSPDDDGKNDLFMVKGMNGKSAKISIYNRWGNKVYFKEGTDLSWDGKANVNGPVFGHNKLPEGTYYYVFESSELKTKAISGFIVVRY